MTPGPIVLLGSGETSPSIRKVYDQLFQRFTPPVRVAILETPAGFEPNSVAVAGQIGSYLEKHLQNYQPQITIVPARKRGTAFSPDDASLVPLLSAADVILMGPGSPTYTIRQLQESVVWEAVRACQRKGAALIFASAATIACSFRALPVYEIYKVGEELHWKAGLSFFEDLGLAPIFVPHWNNNDGGATLDTSRCYIGEERFQEMLALLPDGAEAHLLVGIDEHTALIIDADAQRATVGGIGGVTICNRGSQELYFGSGSSFDVTQLGELDARVDRGSIPEAAWQMVTAAAADVQTNGTHTAAPPEEIQALVAARQQARAAREWSQADALREQIEASGWQVRDTREGSTLEPLESKAG